MVNLSNLQVDSLHTGSVVLLGFGAWVFRISDLGLGCWSRLFVCTFLGRGRLRRNNKKVLDDGCTFVEAMDCRANVVSRAT